MLEPLPSLSRVAPERKAQRVERGQLLEPAQRRWAAAVLGEGNLRRREGTRVLRELLVIAQRLAGLLEPTLGEGQPRSACAACAAYADAEGKAHGLRRIEGTGKMVGGRRGQRRGCQGAVVLDGIGPRRRRRRLLLHGL